MACFHLGYLKKVCQDSEGGMAGKIHTDHVRGMFAIHLQFNGAFLFMMIIFRVITFA